MAGVKSLFIWGGPEVSTHSPTAALLLLFGCTLCADLNEAYLGSRLWDCAEMWAQSWRRRGGNEQPEQFHHRVRGTHGNNRNGKWSRKTLASFSKSGLIYAFLALYPDQIAKVDFWPWADKKWTELSCWLRHNKQLLHCFVTKNYYY